MKLNRLLIAAFIIISTIPLYIALQYLNSHVSSYSRQQFENHLSAMSLIAKKRILSTVDRFKDITALISSSTAMRLDLNRWNQSANVIHQQNITSIINDAKYGLAHLRDLSIYDKQGRLVSTTSPTPRAQQLDKSFALKENLTLVSESDEILALMLKPLILNHETIGYIQIAFFTQFINDLVRDRTGLGETGEWLFAVRHKSGDALFAVPLKYDLNAAFKRRVSKDKLDVPIIQALLGNEKIMPFAPDYLKQPVMASTRYLNELDWGLVAKVNESEVNQLANQNQKIIYIAELLIVLVSIIVGVAISFFIVHPIQVLNKHMGNALSGKLDGQTAVSGWFEMKGLAQHISYMIKELNEFNDGLQKKVDERTQALNEANQQLEILARQDPLTGLDNRREFNERFKQEFNRAKRYKSAVAVVMIDVDNFKTVNDQYGHCIGDEVLKEIAVYLKSTKRDCDIAARMGGEEFCLVLTECSSETALMFLERIRVDISNLEFRCCDKLFKVTCSFGVAYLGDSVKTVDTLLSQADTALYQAKNGGRNRIIQYSGS